MSSRDKIIKRIDNAIYVDFSQKEAEIDSAYKIWTLKDEEIYNKEQDNREDKWRKLADKYTEDAVSEFEKPLLKRFLTASIFIASSIVAFGLFVFLILFLMLP